MDIGSKVKIEKISNKVIRNLFYFQLDALSKGVGLPVLASIATLYNPSLIGFIPFDIQDKVLKDAYSDEEMNNRFKTSLNLVAENNTPTNIHHI